MVWRSKWPTDVYYTSIVVIIPLLWIPTSNTVWPETDDAPDSLVLSYYSLPPPPSRTHQQGLLGLWGAHIIAQRTTGMKFLAQGSTSHGKGPLNHLRARAASDLFRLAA
jgi:hypothetical protein